MPVKNLIADPRLPTCVTASSGSQMELNTRGLKEKRPRRRESLGRLGCRNFGVLL